MMISFRVEARKWSHAPQGVHNACLHWSANYATRATWASSQMSQAYSTARAADASRWQTSSQAYGAFYKLPPREKVKDPHHSLLVALAPAVEPPSRETAPAARALFKHCGGGGGGRRARRRRRQRRSCCWAVSQLMRPPPLLLMSAEVERQHRLSHLIDR